MRIKEKKQPLWVIEILYYSWLSILGFSQIDHVGIVNGWCVRGWGIELSLWDGQWQIPPPLPTMTFCLLLLFYHLHMLVCVCQSCSQSFPCAGRAVRNAFLSHGPYPAKDKIHLARIIRYFLFFSSEHRTKSMCPVKHMHWVTHH